MCMFFVMGDNRWEWTDGAFEGFSDSVKFYLCEDRMLDTVRPSDYSYISYSANPRNPVPACGADRFNPLSPVITGPVDLRDSVLSHTDIVVYRSSPLTGDFEIRGKSLARLFISTDRLDGDVFVRLCDEYPDGCVIVLAIAGRRMRFRNGFATEELMTEGETELIEIDIRNLAHVFLAGHRISLVVSGSCYPQFELNLNNGGTMYVEGDTLIAINRIHSGNETAAHILYYTNSTHGVSENLCPFGSKEPLTMIISPNPFNQSASILTDYERVSSVLVYDIRGRLISSFGSDNRVFKADLNQGSGVLLFVAKGKENEVLQVVKGIYIR